MNWNNVHKWKPINIKLDTNCTLVSSAIINIWFELVESAFFLHTVAIPCCSFSLSKNIKQMWDSIEHHAQMFLSAMLFHWLSNQYTNRFGARLLSATVQHTHTMENVPFYADTFRNCITFSMTWSRSVSWDTKMLNLRSAKAYLRSNSFRGVGNATAMTAMSAESHMWNWIEQTPNKPNMK